MWSKQDALKDALISDNVYSLNSYRNWFEYSQERKHFVETGERISNRSQAVNEVKKMLTDRERVKKIQGETSYRPS